METEIINSEFELEQFDSLVELEDRIQGIAERFGETRRLQQVAEQNAERLEKLSAEQQQKIAHLEAEVRELRVERNRVRERIETLLGRIDSL
jgi:septal ring factor EnvC (AmiA/AmiB activator)